MTDSSPARALPAGARSKWPLAIYVAGLACAVAAYFVARASFGLKYPPPWPDEASFLWQAIAFQENWSLFSPELNPERHVLWMPPGYMVLSGLVFKITGFSLSFARFLSALYVCGALGAVAALAWPLRARLGHLLLCVAYLHSPILLVSGNTARMEPLVALLGTTGFLLLSKDRHYWGIATVTLAPLVHPNGLFFTAFGCAIAALRQKGRWRRPRRAESIALASVALCWAAYAIYAALHLSELVTDLGNQLAWKRFESAGHGGIFGRLLSLPALVPALVLIGASAYAVRFRRDTWPHLALGFCLLTLDVVTVGWMYEVYSAFLLLIVSIIGLETSVDALERFAKIHGPGLFVVSAVLSFVLAVVSFRHIVRSRFMTDSIEVSTVFRWPLEPPYLTDPDHAAVARFLQMTKRASTEPRRVQFVPSAEALLFHELRDDSFMFVQSTTVEGLADLYILHDSIWVPKNVRDAHRVRLMMQQSIPIPVEQWPVLHRRQTEVWRVYSRGERAELTSPRPARHPP